MRHFSSLALIAFAALALAGCKHPDNVKLHPHAEAHVGGPVAFHPHVVNHYTDFQNWANPALAPQSDED